MRGRSGFPKRLLPTFVAAAILGCASPTSREGGGAHEADGPPGAAICTAAKPEDSDRAAAPAAALLPGYGSGGFRVDTASEEAQAYFDNGMQLAHAFAHGQATAAFRRAEAIDPACAMCAWGEAWSRGPTINYGIGDADAAAAARLVARAAALAASRHDTRDDGLIAALALRYGPGREDARDAAFAEAMDALARRYPLDDEIAIVAADAWMIPAARGRDRSHLDRAIALLASVLARSPDDTGAIHFYIHATEMDGESALALPFAAKLETLAPAASHLVHMPSHTFFRVGRYRDAERANVDAVAIDDAVATARGVGVFTLDYHDHNVRFGMVSALMAGDAPGALALARPVVARLATMEAFQSWKQIDLAAAYAVFGRFGSDADVASLVEPSADLPFARAMRHYAVGEAAARRGDRDAVVAEARAIAPARLAAFGGEGKKREAMMAIARDVLDGRAAMLDGRWRDAATSYRRAADRQDEALSDDRDPPDWWYPVRRSLAAALAASGDTKAAAAELARTLDGWPDDPVALAIAADAEARDGRDAAAGMSLARASAGFAGDLPPVALR